MNTRIALKNSTRASLIQAVRGSFIFGLMLLSTVAVFIPFVPVALLKLAAPTAGLRRRLTVVLLAHADAWGRVTRFISVRVLGSRLEVSGLDNIHRDGRYLVICNHQCWLDIPILVQAFLGKARFPRFFIKYELLWFPVVGFACWAMDFPFMRRYSREKLHKHPELKGTDVEATRRACEKYVHMPVTVLNFVEATRGTEAKRKASNSPYRHLLRPKSGGIAFALEAMGDILDGVLDVTIAYPDIAEASLWDYCCGRIPRVFVHVRRLEIPQDLRQGGYSTNPDFRHRFQRWMNTLWQEKDQELDRLMANANPSHSSRSIPS